MNVTAAGQIPPQAIDQISTQPLLTSDDAVPLATTSGDGYSAPAMTEAVNPGTINQALQGGNNTATNTTPQNTQPQLQQLPTDVNARPVVQGETVVTTNHQGANVVGVNQGQTMPLANVNNPANNLANNFLNNGAAPAGGSPFMQGVVNNSGTNGFAPTWLAATSMAHNNLSQSFSSLVGSSFVTLYLSQPETLRAVFSQAVRRSHGHDNHHPTHQQQPSQQLASVFNQLNQQNRLALTSAPGNARGAVGPSALLTEADRIAFTRMVAASMRDFTARVASGAINHFDAHSLQPQSILAAFGLMHADQLGPDWLAHGTTQLIALAQGAGPQEADIIFEALALALILSSLTMLGAPNGNRSELALAQSFSAMQMLGQMQDPDAFAQMFSRLSPAERTQLLTLIATLSPNVKLGSLDKMDPIALLFKAFAARSGDARLGDIRPGDARATDAQRSGGRGAETGATLGTLLGARSALGSRSDALATERLRAELLQFAATQPTSFYYAEAANKKTFHSGRLEAVLQVIVQQLLRELAAKAGRLSRLRCDFADSIELLSNLLDLLTQRDDEDNEHSHGQQDAEADENDSQEADYSDKDGIFNTRPHFTNARNPAQPRGNMTAEYACQTLFRVVPDAKSPGKVAFRWETFGKDAIANLPRRLAPDSVEITELQQLQDYARVAVVAPAIANASAAEPSYEVLSELLMPSDAAYALGAAAAGATIMARHWHCKMWAHDLTYRLNEDGSKAQFDFTAYAHQQSISNGNLDREIASANAMPPPRAETAMRHDLLRMLENSQDRWVREQASQALAAALQKLKNNNQTSVESKGEVVRSLRSPMMRDATIYFLSRYYFKLHADTSDGNLVNQTIG